MSGERNRFGLFDALPTHAPADDFRRSVQTYSLTGVAVTRMWNGDWFYAVDTTAASRTVTLPVVGDEMGHHHFVKRVTGGSNECNIVEASAAAVLDGSATHSIAAQYGVRCYFSDGTSYQQVAGNFISGSAHIGGSLGVSATLSSTTVIAVTSGSNDVRMTNDGGIEIAKSGGNAYIDFKDAAGDDYDIRLQQAGTGAGLIVTNNGGAASMFQILATNASGYTGEMLQIYANQAGGSGFVFLACRSDVDGTPDYEFFVRGDGEIFGDGAAYNTPADYGEYRESWDGNDIPVGTTVVLVGAKVRASNAGDNPADVIGVVRPKDGAATLATNAANLRWTGRYLKDPYGAYIRGKDGERIQSPDFKPVIVEVTTRDAKGKETTQKLVQYIPRSERQEWVLVGMLGAVAINRGQLMGDRWRKMRDITPEVEEWHIR